MRILIACDGSEIGESAAAAVAQWAMPPNTEVHLLAVIDPGDLHGVARSKHASSLFLGPATAQGRVMPSIGRTDSAASSDAEMLPTDDESVAGTGAPPAETKSQAVDRVSSEHFDYLRIVASHYFPGSDVEVHIEFSDDPAEEIAEQAVALEADVIALGSHGRSGISRALMGSVAAKLIQTSQVPVLVVGPAARERMTVVPD